MSGANPIPAATVSSWSWTGSSCPTSGDHRRIGRRRRDAKPPCGIRTRRGECCPPWPRVSTVLGVSIERREFLLLGGAMATGAGLAGCTNTPRGSASPGGSRSGSAPAAPSAAASPPGGAQVPLGPQVVHGPRDRARVALTFHGQGPVQMADGLLAEADRAGARGTALAVGPWLAQNPHTAPPTLPRGHG